ncbi:MAG TPA: YebC/PmpR family DNA-binding transcriptional regulator, partial [Methylomirabilota bacterium]|nr:YebC/PmpR family DNA-binding transcriptional regulator [Methylomirabilota bacterium]
LFRRRGQIIVSRDAAREDELMELALEAGADDFRAEPQGFEILTDPGTFEEVHRQLENRGIQYESAEVTSLPELTMTVSDRATVEAVNRLMELLDEHDDVKEIHSNAEFPGES